MTGEDEFVFASRYDAFREAGIVIPPASLACKGPCEATGWVPVSRGGQFSDTDDERLQALWDEAERENPNEPGDSWHFVRCPDCNGTGIEGAPNDDHHFKGDPT